MSKIDYWGPNGYIAKLRRKRAYEKMLDRKVPKTLAFHIADKCPLRFLPPFEFPPEIAHFRK